MGLFVLTLFYLLLSISVGHCTNKHMICKDVDDVFDEDVDTVSMTRRLQGPAGKRGIRGENGIRGEPGEPGRADYQRIKEIVRTIVDEETRAMKKQINEGKEEMMELTEQIQNMTELINLIPVINCEGVRYRGKCYWAETHSNAHKNLAQAEAICRSKESKLADIYSKDHYDMIMKYLRSKLNGRTNVYYWTGMKKIYKNEIAQLSNETSAEYTQTRLSSGSWKTASATRTNVYIVIRSLPTEPDQGMGAIWPSYSFRGTLCQSQ